MNLRPFCIVNSWLNNQYELVLKTNKNGANRFVIDEWSKLYEVEYIYHRLDFELAFVTDD